MRTRTVKIEFDDDTISVIDHVNRALKKAKVAAKFTLEGSEDDERFIYKLTVQDK